MKRKIFLPVFFSILFLGTFLRLYQLGTVPGSLEWDEVSYGYNAYAILQTGKDEYGETLPFAFRAFGEYKQPVYLYLDVLSIHAFGLNAFAIRLPAALFGSLSIVFVFLLVSELFHKFTYAKRFALLSMFFFAISPWSIQFSRAAFEATVSLCFVIAGVWLFLRGLRLQKRWYCIVSVLLLSLSTYTYISQKVFVPLLFVALLLFGFRFFKKQKVFAGLIIALFLILNVLWLFDAKSVSRGQGVFITNQQAAILDESIRQMQHDRENNDHIGLLLHNRRIVYTQAVLSNYLSHFDPVWLFFSSDEVKRHHAPGFGQLYLVSLPFILAGIYFLLSRMFATAWILFAWFLFAPVAAALTFESPHA
jgi:4-amino-4-deoxy-L-arabinose transferase-like glycosyltransferase